LEGLNLDDLNDDEYDVKDILQNVQKSKDNFQKQMEESSIKTKDMALRISTDQKLDK